jgi:hypothetical protein
MTTRWRRLLDRICSWRSFSIPPTLSFPFLSWHQKTPDTVDLLPDDQTRGATQSGLARLSVKPSNYESPTPIILNDPDRLIASSSQLQSPPINPAEELARMSKHAYRLSVEHVDEACELVPSAAVKRRHPSRHYTDDSIVERFPAV